MYLMPGDGDQPTLIPGWIHIVGNLIMNGPSGNRDLGNMFPAIDNDDGSAYYRMVRNVLVYGGAKNYLGHDKIWARHGSAEDFSPLNALLCTTMAWILIPAYCFAIP